MSNYLGLEIETHLFSIKSFTQSEKNTPYVTIDIASDNANEKKKTKIKHTIANIKKWD